MIKTVSKVLTVTGLLVASAWATYVLTSSPGGSPSTGIAGDSSRQTTGTAVAAPGPAGSPSPALPVDVAIAIPPKLDYAIQATGNLVPAESVEITPEQSRRLSDVLVREGASVRKGDVLFRLDTSDLVPRLTELEAQLEQSRREEDRLASLLRSQAISQSALDEVATEVRRLRAQILLVKDAMVKAEIRAPFDGRVGLRRVSPGAWLTPGTLMTTLADVSTIKVDFKVPERYASSLPKDAVVRFRVEGVGGWNEARLVAVEPLLDQATRSVVARAVAPNPDSRLQAGAFVNVEVPLARLTEGVMVPSEAIVPSARGLSVFLEQQGKVVSRAVRVGVRTPDAVQVLEGLQPGDRVIASNLLRLRPNLPVRVVSVREDANNHGSGE
jgi:membrane fusion protein (multidrug efflux system)